MHPSNSIDPSLSSVPNYVVKPSTPNKYRPKFGWVVILGMLILY